MRKVEWLIVGLLIGVGLICLTASASTMGESMEGVLRTFLQVCIWMGLPLLIIGVIYFIFLKSKK